MTATAVAAARFESGAEERMELRRFDDPRAFHDAALEFLIANEAAHNLLLGITADLIGTSLYREHQPYLATVEQDGTVIAAALHTPPYNLQLSLASPAAIALLTADVHADHPDLPGVQGPEEVARAFADAWSAQSGSASEPGIPQRIYQADTIRQPDGIPGKMRSAAHADYDLLLTWNIAFNVEAYGAADAASAARRLNAYFEGTIRGLYVWHDGEPVSMAGFSGPTPNGIRIGPVYTPPEHRRRGYASALSAALSQLLLDQGRRYCFLFTDRNNATTNHIYREIGYEPVVDVNEHRFVE